MIDPAEAKRAGDLISKARALLILDHPFYAALALRLELRADPRAQTMATDGRRLYYNPPWVLKHPVSQVETIVAHEAMHCALAHMVRRQGREPRRWNIANDHVVNLLLAEPSRDSTGKTHVFDMPKSATMDPRYKGMASEAIYPLLPPAAVAADAGEAWPDYGGTGCVIDALGDGGKPLQTADREGLEREWKIATLAAAQAAKAQGHLPAGLDGLIESIAQPKVDWRAALREFVRMSSRNDYSWRRPNMRHIGGGDYFPSLYDETTGPIAMGVDTSGSVSDAELQAVCAELNGCLETAKPERVDVVYCDAVAHGHETFTPDLYPVRISIQGRGGTNLAPLWPYMREYEIEPVCAIVTTDMELCVRDLGDEPDFPVLFLSTGREEPMDGPLPFGRLVRLEVD